MQANFLSVRGHECIDSNTFHGLVSHSPCAMHDQQTGRAQPSLFCAFNVLFQGRVFFITP
uniref:Uncharacterized protein n=1 Tax=Anguilla anguilla TaxID=7936 RepID=A0A0E9PR83_ANGAN